MKRSELILGAEYLFAPSHKWSEDPDAVIHRVQVLDLQPWVGDRYPNSQTHKVVTDSGELLLPDVLNPAPTGNGVLVRVLDKGAGEPLEGKKEFRVVQTLALRGEWEKTWPEKQAKVEAIREEYEKRRAKAVALHERAGTLAEQMPLPKGSVSISSGWVGSTHQPTIVLSLDAAEALVARLKQS